DGAELGSRWKVISMLDQAATGSPSLLAGLNFHCFTAVIAASSNAGDNDLITRASFTRPSVPTRTFNISTPWIFPSLADSGNWGSGDKRRRGAETPLPLIGATMVGSRVPGPAPMPVPSSV